MPWGDIAAFLVVLAGGALTSWLVDRILPLQRIPGNTADLASLTAKYKRLQLRATCLWLLMLLPASSVGSWQLLRRLAQSRYAKLGRFEIAFLPGGVEWGFPAVFFAGVISILLLWLAVRIYLGPDYGEYRLYEKLRWGIGTWVPVLGLIALFTGSAVFTIAMLDCYSVFAPDRIRINAFFSAGERTYCYQDVRAIRTAPKWTALVGNEVERREFVLCFRDGTSWSTTYAPGIVTERNRRRLAEFVSGKSEVPITELAVLTRQAQSCR